MKYKIEYILKHSIIIQRIYKILMSFVFRVIGIFITQDESLVLFSSFGGRKYNDSPKVIFEAMRDDDRFKNYHYVWAFERPEDFAIDGAQSIKIDTWQYFKTALKARVWITSVNIERGLHFKKKKTIYINTWHGAGTKKIGNACIGRKDYDFSNVDIMLVQSEFEKEIFLRDFKCNKDAIRIIGFPRNDELFCIDNKIIEETKKELNIPGDKKVILYAPTWRDSKNGGNSYDFVCPLHMEKWRKCFSTNYIMLFRMHAFTTNFNMQYDSFAIDVSSYENLNHILAIADVVITDYSTIVYDCAIANKPFICFGFDYDIYKMKRGFYFDLNSEYPGGVLKDEDDVIDRVAYLTETNKFGEFVSFRHKYIEAGGNSTVSVLNELAQMLA